jgi:hypothetical protein
MAAEPAMVPEAPRRPQAGLSCELVNVKQLEKLDVVENSDGSFSEAPLNK